MHLTGKVEFKFYAAAAGFLNQPGTVQATLRHLSPTGVTLWSTTASKARTWENTWKRETIKFEEVDRYLPAGDTLELGVGTPATSPSAMMLALDTEEQESHLKMTLVDPLLESSVLYLAPAAPSNTPSQAVLSLSATEPQGSTLYNYDSERDSKPGIVLRRGSSNGFESDPAKIQRWRLPQLESQMQLPPSLELTFYAAMKDFRKSHGKVWVHLLDVDENGQVVSVIASRAYERTWNSKWESAKVKFEDLFGVMESAHHLEIAFTVDAASQSDMWFAFGTSSQKAQVELSTDHFFPVPANAFLATVGAPQAWAMGYQGEGVRVAVLDSGIWRDAPDFEEPDGFKRVIEEVHVNPTISDSKDKYGHGTFMAGIIGSNGSRSEGLYKGIAPRAEMINVRVSDGSGGATEASVVAGMQWVLENKDAYNIRVVNMSLNSTTAQSYHTSPMNAAAEVLWFNGVVVVVAGGNNGNRDQGIIYPPANDPFVIAVGATDDRATRDPSDDSVATFSAFGTTPEGFSRPDLAAPGTYVVSSLAHSSRFESDYADLQARIRDRSGSVAETNFVASGTSASAAVVSGAAVLLLQAVPGLNPDQVKWLLMHSATPLAGEQGAGTGIVNIPNAIQMAKSYASVASVPTANTGLPGSNLLMTGDNATSWSSVNWGSVNWGSVNWGSVNWGSVNWGSVNWGSVNWGSVDLGY